MLGDRCRAVQNSQGEEKGNKDKKGRREKERNEKRRKGREAKQRERGGDVRQLVNKGKAGEGAAGGR